jgi:hypothetical protein
MLHYMTPYTIVSLVLIIIQFILVILHIAGIPYLNNVVLIEKLIFPITLVIVIPLLCFGIYESTNLKEELGISILLTVFVGLFLIWILYKDREQTSVYSYSTLCLISLILIGSIIGIMKAKKTINNYENKFESLITNATELIKTSEDKLNSIKLGVSGDNI